MTRRLTNCGKFLSFLFCLINSKKPSTLGEGQDQLAHLDEPLIEIVPTAPVAKEKKKKTKITRFFKNIKLN